MIYDKLSELSRYLGLLGNFDLGIGFLQTTDLSALPMGRIEIAGGDVYCNHFAYATQPMTGESAFEAHRRFLDLHVVLAGRERVALSPIESLLEVEIRENEDSVMYRGTPENELILEPGRFLLVFPGEGHLPKLAAGEPVDVDKLVMKIAL